MGLARMVGSTVATLGIAGVLLQATGAYDVKNNVVSPVVETVKEDSYSGLKGLKLVDFKNTNDIWDSISPEQRQELGRRGVATLTLEQRTDFVRKEWPLIKPDAKYLIVKAELDAMLERFYK